METARRAEVLQRVQAGEISNVEAAAELGLTPGAWAGWKSYYQKRHDVIVPAVHAVRTRMETIVPAPTGRSARTRNESIVPAPAVRAASAPDVAELVVRLEKVERFGKELKRRVRDLVAFVEERAPR